MPRRVLSAAAAAALSFGASAEDSRPPTGQVNPRILQSIQLSICHDGRCIRIGRPRYDGLNVSESSLDDKHALLRASDTLTDAIGATLLAVPIPEDETRLRRGVADSDLQTVLVELVVEAPKLSEPVFRLYERAIEKAVVPAAASEAVRTCARVFARAFRLSLEQDPLVVARRGCGAGDEEEGFEVLIATMTLMRERAAQTREALEKDDIARVASALVPRLEAHAKKIERFLERKSNDLAAYLESEASRQRSVPTTVLERVALAHNAGRQAWEQSNVRLACLRGTQGQVDASLIEAVTRARFDAMSSLIARRWTRLAGDGVLARLVGTSLSPRLAAAEMQASLRGISVRIVDGPPEQAGFQPGERAIILPTGLVAQLCRDAQVNEVEAILRRDGDELARLLNNDSVSFRDVYESFTQMRSPAALAYAERRELEFVAALDFVIAHELAHSLFDHGKQARAMPQRERELRADAFAFAVVDRTSQIAFFKKVASLGVWPDKEDSRTDRLLKQASPGGAAMLRVYRNTTFEQDPGHLPLRERMQWMEEWVGIPQ